MKMLRAVISFGLDGTKARRVRSALPHPQVLARLTAMTQLGRGPCSALGSPSRHRMVTLVGHTPAVVVRRLLFTVPRV
jgi:hypothetical protein